MRLLMHKKSGRLVVAYLGIGTIIEFGDGSTMLLGQFSTWSDFEIIGDI